MPTLQGLRYNTNPLKSQRADNLNGIYRARVEDNKDPMGLGRVQIRVPSLHGLAKDNIVSKASLPWAHVIAQSAGYGYGSFMIPEIGEYVFIQFEDNSQYKPIVLGSAYGTNSKYAKKYGEESEDDEKWEGEQGGLEVPASAQRPNPSRKILYASPTGAEISVDEKVGGQGMSFTDGLGQGLSISTALSSKGNKGPKASRKSDNTSVTLSDSGNQSITMTTDLIKSVTTINGSNGYNITIDPTDMGMKIDAVNSSIFLDKEGNVTISGKSISIVGSNEMTLMSAGHIGIYGDGVTIGGPVTLLESSPNTSLSENRKGLLGLLDGLSDEFKDMLGGLMDMLGNGDYPIPADGDWLAIALSQIGTNEYDGSADKFVQALGFNNSADTPWCASFVTWCMKQSGADFKGSASVANLLQQAKDSGRFASSSYNGGTYIPKPGDIFLQKQNGASHTGFVVSVDLASGTYTTVEGNASNQCKQVTRKLNDSKLTGFYVT